jgi:hypothetical protein
MATTVQILTTNYSGETAQITFSPCSGGTIDLGSHELPYNHISNDDNHLGDYLLYFVSNNESCTFTIPCPTATPTPTPEPTSTPTVTPNPTSTPTPTETPTPTPTPCPEPGPVLRTFCDGIDLREEIAGGPDGCGKVDYVIEYNAIACGGSGPTPTPEPTYTPTPTPTPEPTITPTPTPEPTFSYIGCGYGNTAEAACSNSSLNPQILYSNCDSFEFGLGCIIYVDTFPNALTGYSYVFINTSLWNVNPSTGVVTGFAPGEQC